MMKCGFLIGAVSGALIHKFGNRPIAILGFVMVAFGLAISSLARSVAMLYLTYGFIAGRSMTTVWR